MQNIEYREALTEVLEILNHTKKQDVDRIPEKVMNFIKQNCSKEYKFCFDFTKPISKLNLKPKAQAFLGLLYLNYMADEPKKNKFKIKILEKEQEYRNIQREKYNPYIIFNKKKYN